jgi:hypothetical protein
MKIFPPFLVAPLLLIVASCSFIEGRKSPFSLTETDKGIEVSENGRPVFFYQKSPKTLTGQYVCSNYIHPLYNLNGDVITEEFPADHPFHRGVFWAWHQLYRNNVRLGDGWTNDSISQEVVKISSEKGKDRVGIDLEVFWHSSTDDTGKPFIEERTSITVNKIKSGIRTIDFEISLRALHEGIQIGGSADQKGYGGFCVRMKLPDSLVFSSVKGAVTPQELQVKAGPWMDFSGKFGEADELSGITILCNQGMPDYPEQWILRQKGSMQNIVFPGSKRINVPVKKPLVLRYRIIIHNGDAGSLDIPMLMEEYSRIKNNG